MPANPNRGETEIEIGGHKRTFRWRTSQIAMLEDRLDCGITRILSEDKIGLKTLVEALFVGHVHLDRRLTPAKTAKWVDDFKGDLGDLMSEVFTGIASGLPGVQMEEEEDSAPLAQGSPSP